jgi:type 1 fimbriae regulatory protein FimB/type 1 fimbriae regulatory protein FimE
MPRKKAGPTKHAPPLRVENKKVRTREHLTSAEVELLRRAASRLGRNGHRDQLMILMSFRHAWRCAETVTAKWEQIDWQRRTIHINRKKHGKPSTHPLTRTELAGLRKLPGYPECKGTIFTSERRAPMSERAFHHVVARAGKEAGLNFAVHPHMFRHACGFELANQGRDTRAIQDYLGHSNIQHTVRYTELAAGRFEGFFED